MITTTANLTIESFKEGHISFVELRIEEHIANHGRVEIKIDIEKLGLDVLSDPMDRIKLINEKFEISVYAQKQDGGPELKYTFLGLITDVQVELDKGEHGWMYIYGASRSIELERGKKLKTFSDKDLQTIVEDVTKGKVNVYMAGEPAYTTELKFSMQYYETDFQYLKRLAMMYGEKFFFDGNALVFGEKDNEETTQITYGKELVEVKLNSRLISNKFTQYYHTLKEEEKPDNKHLSHNESVFTGITGILSDKLNLSDDISPKIPIATPVYDDDSLKKLSEIRRKSQMSRMFYVTGATNRYATTIGQLLEINFNDKMNVKDSINTLRITHVVHLFDQNKRYYSTFEACQKSEEYPHFPYGEIDMPNAQPIEATVKDNIDPDGFGKIQVQFDFEDDICQYWLKCLSPDGGGYSAIGIERNRGINFIPEIKDRVLIGFLAGNPDKPYVMGALYHGSNAKNLGGGQGNHLKYIRDKSGTEIVFNDKEGSLKVFSPKGNSTILIDGKGNISITTPKTITMNATDITLNASEEIKLNAGSAIKLGVGKDPDNIVINTEDDTVSITSSKNTIKGEGAWNGGNVFIN